MKKVVAGVALLLLLSAVPAGVATAAPTHGCDQANENDGDVYDSTCDGSASENGNGGGNANGQPCAGCVGAADNKNPNGQLPNAEEDGNNGYECDGNNGVAKGNPAHTACEPYSGAVVEQGSQKLKAKNATDFRFRQQHPRDGSGRISLLVLIAGVAVLVMSTYLWRVRRTKE